MSFYVDHSMPSQVKQPRLPCGMLKRFPLGFAFSSSEAPHTTSVPTRMAISHLMWRRSRRRLRLRRTPCGCGASGPPTCRRRCTTSRRTPRKRSRLASSTRSLHTQSEVYVGELFRRGVTLAVSFMTHLEASRSTCSGRRRARPRARSATRPARRPRSRTCEGSAWKRCTHARQTHRRTRPHVALCMCPET
jgi:hypothetical protein